MQDEMIFKALFLLNLNTRRQFILKKKLDLLLFSN